MAGRVVADPEELHQGPIRGCLGQELGLLPPATRKGRQHPMRFHYDGTYTCEGRIVAFCATIFAIRVMLGLAELTPSAKGVFLRVSSNPSFNHSY
jgi:hypothetical protein